MDWKDFLKPTREKIIVFFTLPLSYLILLISLGWIDFLLIVINALYSILTLPIFLFWHILNAAGIEPFPNIATGLFTEIFGELLLVLFAIIWIYLISCLLIHIYSEFKTKK